MCTGVFASMHLAYSLYNMIYGKYNFYQEIFNRTNLNYFCTNTLANIKENTFLGFWSLEKLLHVYIQFVS